MSHMHAYVCTYIHTCTQFDKEVVMDLPWGCFKNIPGDIRKGKRYREDSPETICTRTPTWVPKRKISLFSF